MIGTLVSAGAASGAGRGGAAGVACAGGGKRDDAGSGRAARNGVATLGGGALAPCAVDL